MDHTPPSLKVDKPWGGFEQYTHNLPSTVKIITVAPGGTLSRQYHHHRDELWVVLDPGQKNLHTGSAFSLKTSVAAWLWGRAACTKRAKPAAGLQCGICKLKADG